MTNQSEAASRGALVRLLLFAATLAVLPVSSHFLSLRYLWAGNHNYAAMTAVCTANAVLVAYILTAIWEDRQDAEGENESKKLR